MTKLDELMDLAKTLRLQAKEESEKEDADKDLLRVYNQKYYETLQEINRTRAQGDDPVNHPSHYTYGSIECIDYLDAIGVGFDFCRGNVIKYTTRLGHKVDDVEDAKKVVWYAQHIVDKLKDGTYQREEEVD